MSAMKATPRHNYQDALDELIRTGKVSPEGLTHVVVKHDSWCAVYKQGGYCNCKPEIEIPTIQ